MRKSDQATKVRAYIKANPKAKPSAVAKACGVHAQYVYALKYQDKRKAKAVRKMAPAKPVTLDRDVYKQAMDKLVESLRDVIRDRDAVIDYLEYKLEKKNEANY